MKKVLILLAAAVLLVSFASCAPKDKNNKEEKQPLQNESSETEKEDKVQEEQKIVLDIKPLDEVDEITLGEAAKKLGFENEKLFHAVANAMGKSPFEMTQTDIDKVHYIAVGPEAEGDSEYTVYIGYIDYVDACFSEDYSEDNIMQKLNDLVLVSEFSYNKETDSLADLGNFENVEMFEIYDVEIDDVSFIKNYPILALGYFKNNGITDVSSLADYNPESLIELDLTGNSISDWTPLYPIKEKVTVFYGTVDGMPMVITLEDMLNQQNGKNGESQSDAVDNGEEPNGEVQQKTEQDEIPILVDENGEQVDFSSLFD